MTSPFLINLDVVVQYASAPYPHILGPMMVNDYIQGLDPARRLHARKFLNRFQQERPENTYIVAEANRQRLILQHSANNWDGGMSGQAVEGYFHNPRDAPLALSVSGVGPDVQAVRRTLLAYQAPEGAADPRWAWPRRGPSNMERRI